MISIAVTQERILILEPDMHPPMNLMNSIAKLMITICNNYDPFLLFHDILSHSVLERQRPARPKFFDTSRTRIGKQSLANRVGIITLKINFDWLDHAFSL